MTRAPGPRIGVLLLNVGTPDAPRAPEVRRYLREFLGDPRVIDSPAPIRWMVLNLFILPFRPQKSAEMYEKVWMPEGSPLLVYGTRFRDRLASALGERYEVAVAMRYGNPSISAALERLRGEGIDRIVAFPLYPQYASATTGTSLEAVYHLTAVPWNTPFVSAVPPFYVDPDMVAAYAAIGRPVIDEIRAEHVLFSFHGLPERQILKGDASGGSHCLRSATCCDAIVAANRYCYRAQCFATARAIAAKLDLREGAWTTTFQSRLGRTPWIRPYTDEVVIELARKGVKRVAAFSPAFVADCLETLEEIGLRARDSFVASGGEEFRLVPSLNDHPLWVEAAARMVRRAAGDDAV